jgi:hypothetical protein
LFAILCFSKQYGGKSQDTVDDLIRFVRIQLPTPPTP